MRVSLYFLCLLMVGPLFAVEVFSRSLISEAVEAADKAKELRGQGKTVKAEREENKARDALKKYLIKGKRYSLPDSCFFRHQLHIVEFSCEELRDIRIHPDQPDRKTLEDLEECEDLCVGDFIIVANNPYTPNEMIRVDEEGIHISIKMVSAKKSKRRSQE